MAAVRLSSQTSEIGIPSHASGVHNITEIVITYRIPRRRFLQSSVQLGLAAAGQQSAAKKYFDYRELLEQKDLDAVVVATPDHHHAPATVRALRRGLHVYCEKALTHTVVDRTERG